MLMSNMLHVKIGIEILSQFKHKKTRRQRKVGTLTLGMNNKIYEVNTVTNLCSHFFMDDFSSLVDLLNFSEKIAVVT